MVIIPARDEGPRVGAVVRACRVALPGVPVVVVENASTDDTVHAARAAGAEVIHSAPGYAIATRVGFVHARDRGADWVVTLDADGQHPPDAVPRLLAALAHADLAIGSRFLGNPGYPIPVARRAAIHVLGVWASILSRQRLRDVTSGMRALRRPVFESFADDYPPDVADANVLVRAVRRGWRVTEVPVSMNARAGGDSQHGGLDGAAFALRMAVYTAREALRGAQPDAGYRRDSMK